MTLLNTYKGLWMEHTIWSSLTRHKQPITEARLRLHECVDTQNKMFSAVVRPYYPYTTTSLNKPIQSYEYGYLTCVVDKLCYITMLELHIFWPVIHENTCMLGNVQINQLEVHQNWWDCGGQGWFYDPTHDHSSRLITGVCQWLLTYNYRGKHFSACCTPVPHWNVSPIQ
jgi:hypothetical protein